MCLCVNMEVMTLICDELEPKGHYLLLLYFPPFLLLIDVVYDSSSSSSSQTVLDWWDAESENINIYLQTISPYVT